MSVQGKVRVRAVEISGKGWKAKQEENAQHTLDNSGNAGATVGQLQQIAVK